MSQLKAELAFPIVKAAGASLQFAMPLWTNELWVLTSFIIFAGISYEKGESALKQAVPKPYKPVVNAMFNELGALGFVAMAVFLVTHWHPGHGPLSLFQMLLSWCGLLDAGHLIHKFEVLHFSLFFILNLYFVQVLAVVLSVVGNYRNIRNFGKLPGNGGNLAMGNHALPSNVLRIMDNASKERKGIFNKLWGAVYRSKSQKIGEFFLFQRRFNSLQSDGGDTLNFSEYLEKSVGRLLESLVHITARCWVVMWLAFTAFLCSSAGIYAVAPLTTGSTLCAVFIIAQTAIAVATLSLQLKLSKIKTALLPSLSAKARSFMSSQEEGSKAGGEEWVGCARDCVSPPPYLDLPATEPKRWYRQPVRSLMHWRVPRNKHEQLFGTSGGSGVQTMKGLVQVIFFLSTLMITVDLLVIQKTPIVKASSWVLKAASFVPSALVIASMPEAILKLNYISCVEENTSQSTVAELVLTHRRDTFHAGMRSLLSFLLLFRDGDSNLYNKITHLQKLAKEESEKGKQVPSHRQGSSGSDDYLSSLTLKRPPVGVIAERPSAEEECETLKKFPREIMVLLEDAFSSALHDEDTPAIRQELKLAQMVEAVKYFGFALSKEQAQLLFDYMDRGSNGNVDFQEFAAALLLPAPGMKPLTDKAFDPDVVCAAVDALFNLMDEDGDGVIALTELESTFQKMEGGWNGRVLLPLFREFDLDHSGNLDRNEVRTMISGADRKSVV